MCGCLLKRGRGAHLEQISFFLRSVSENAARRPLKTEMVDPSSPGPRMKDGQNGNNKNDEGGGGGVGPIGQEIKCAVSQ